jgi:hypothetical protein
VGLQALVMRGMGLAVVWREAQVFLSVFQCLFLCQDGLPFGFQFRVSHGASSLVPWKRDVLHKSRSAAPGWQGATTEHIGHM